MSGFDNDARRNPRPIPPNPLIATLIATTAPLVVGVVLALRRLPIQSIFAHRGPCLFSWRVRQSERGANTSATRSLDDDSRPTSATTPGRSRAAPWPSKGAATRPRGGPATATALIEQYRGETRRVRCGVAHATPRQSRPNGVVPRYSRSPPRGRTFLPFGTPESASRASSRRR